MNKRRSNRKSRRAPFLIGAALSYATLFGFGLSCEAEHGGDPTGGETHFLRVCDADADDCGHGLRCICGACTVPCEKDDACSQLEGATCEASSAACGEDLGAATCDVVCQRTEDCLGLSAAAACLSGRCRLSSSSPEDGSSSSEGGDGGAPSDCATDEVAANEVLVIGDSFFATTHQVTAFLEDFAREAGALQTGERYRDDSRLVGNALALDGGGILAQYQNATEEAPAKLVIMNGGGADVLLGSCEVLDEKCPLIENAASAFEDLLVQIGADGVADVIYVAYPDPEPMDVRARMDVLRPLLANICRSSRVPCHVVDLRAAFSESDARLISDDGLNPTSEGSQRAAAEIWQLMQEQCIAQ